MGELYLHDLEKYRATYSCDTFVETGTGKGTGLNHALNYRFKALYSIEYVPQLYEECLAKFEDSRLTLINSDSLTGLKTILENIDSSPCLFWLDAHFPGADFHFNSYDHLSDQPELHMPLQHEVELISKEREGCRDVFIIDDLHIYEDGPFQLGKKEVRERFGNHGSEFITEAFGETHDFHRDYRHQGFLIITPK